MLEVVCAGLIMQKCDRIAEGDYHIADFQAISGSDFPYCLIAAWAAARRAMGTRNGEQDT